MSNRNPQIITTTMFKFVISVILLTLFVASDGSYWGVPGWVAEKKVEKIERRLERVFNLDQGQ